MTAALNLLNSLKVNVADIVNTLTETAAGKVLDARQGAVLDGKITSHTSNVENPHLVKKSQVGLGAVNNTSDADKPISTAQAAEFAKMVKKDGSVAMDTLTVTGNASAGGDMDIGAGKKYKIGGVNMGPGDIGAEPAISKKTAFNPDFETSATNIKMNGTQALGSSSNVARSDHVHPTDTSRVPATRTVNGKALSANISLSAADVGAVPTSRTVNGKALSSNISLSGLDITVGSDLSIFEKLIDYANTTYSSSGGTPQYYAASSYTFDVDTGIYTLTDPTLGYVGSTHLSGKYFIKSSTLTSGVLMYFWVPGETAITGSSPLYTINNLIRYRNTPVALDLNILGGDSIRKTLFDLVKNVPIRVGAIGDYEEEYSFNSSSGAFGGAYYPDRTLIKGSDYSFDDVTGTFTILDEISGGTFPDDYVGKYAKISTTDTEIYRITSKTTMSASGSPPNYFILNKVERFYRGARADDVTLPVSADDSLNTVIRKILYAITRLEEGL